MTEIDFTQWTDAQLEVGLRFTGSPNHAALKAEYDRRRAAGTSDGSHERVAELLASTRGRRTRRSRR